ncbi:MAG TPA: class I SAM-dependent methyltransferase [Thermoanaerobaculia bacterium]|nr:class I SAM-dependent methyltransferase [Thermoanaerobaculia bacterium]
MIRLDPPGTFCQIQAVCDRMDPRGQTFLEVGCGSGILSRELCRLGLTGTGVDFSAEAIRIAEETLARYLQQGRYRLFHADVRDLDAEVGRVDLGLSMMTMEHVEDDVGFVRALKRFVKPGGQVIVGVPGRRDRWGFEDEVVGHLRRYERGGLAAVLREAGLEDVEVWSVAVPVANLLFHLGNFLVRRSTGQEVARQSQREQTETSGIREVPWKTVFPSWLRLLLNRRSLHPLFWVQRLFYRTGLGLTLIASGRVPGSPAQRSI